MIYFHGGAVISHPIVLHENLVLAATMTASTTAAGFSPAAAATDNTYEVWKAGAVEAILYATFAAAQMVDTVALVGHNGHLLGGGRILMGYRADLVSGFTYVGGDIYATDGGPAVVMLPSAVSARQLIAYVPSTPAPAVVPLAVALFVAGRRLELPAWVQPDSIRAPDAVTVDGEAAISRGGQYLGATIKRRGGRTAPQFSPIERVWFDANMTGFLAHYDARRPFIFGSAPSHHPSDVVYGWRADGAGELRPRLVGGGAHLRFGLEVDFHAP